MKVSLLLVLFSILPTFCTLAQIGDPHIQNFPPASYQSKAYISSPQNWDIIQDARGVMFFANTSGVLEFDGTNWRMVQGSDNKHFIRLAMDEQGKIYASAAGDIGYLSVDSLGKTLFISLLPELDEKYRDFSVAYVIVIGGDIFFHTREYLLRWSNESFSIWPSAGDFWRSFSVKNNLYIQDSGLGLLSILGDSLSLIPQGKEFKNLRIQQILPLGEATSEPADWLALTYENGMFRFTKDSVSKVSLDGQPMLRKAKLMNGLPLDDGLIALATETEGIILVDSQINVQQTINQGSGLLDNSVINVYQDKEQGLWAGLNEGISRVEYPSSITVFTEKAGINGTAYSFLRTSDNRLLIGTSSGLYKLEDQSEPETHFTKITSAITEVWDMVEYKGSILLATSSGVFELKESNLNRITPPGLDGAYKIYQLKAYPEKFLIGLATGVGSMKNEGRSWTWEGEIAGIEHEVRTFGEVKDKLWVGYEEVSRIDFSSGFESRPKIERFDAFQELAEELGIFELSSIDNRVLFGTYEGIYSFDEKTFKLFPDSTYGARFADGSREALALTKDLGGHIWLLSGDLVNRLEPNSNNSYNLDYHSYKRIPATNVWKIYPDQEEVVWFGTTEGIFRYDGKIQKDISKDFNTLIRRIRVKNDSNVFNGAFVDLVTLRQPEFYEFALPFDQRDISFEYTATSYPGNGQSSYSYLLEGYDQSWS
ncbi:MAG: hypothetical protein ACR2MX_09540, partial [Cyclobacteriaceae bacterium]